ncbi:NAD(P)H-dependent oxidoreductase subunit E [bacterium]|nr:NAD(P)H-dependent oxidoreductase subunit E [bacterium]MBU1984531.1 NAD(P)H-dependent oxidoreductase subunit E [bacterium]
MILDFRKPLPASADRRWKIVQAEMRRHGYAPTGLIEVLHVVQDTFGYLDRDSLQSIAHSLRLPLSKVYGVATFYHDFKINPPGQHQCSVCTGSACYIQGVPELLERIEQELGVRPEETTADGKLHLSAVRCFGACGLALVAMFDDKIVGKLTQDELVARLKEMVHHDS